MVINEYCVSLILSEVTAAKTTDNMETRDQDDVDDDDLSTNSNPPTLNLFPTTTLRRK